MDCENRLCVYWEEGSCLLDRISIDSLGMCSAYIQIDLDEHTLKAGRAAFLARCREEETSENPPWSE